MDFYDSLKYVLQFEGGFVDDPTDHGGATNKGITQVVYDSFKVKNNRSLQSVKNIENGEVENIYKEEYWDICHCDGIRSPINLLVFDSAIQHGPQRAIKWLQSVLKTTIDGFCGDNTLYALNDLLFTSTVDNIIQQYIQIRENFYKKIIENDPSQKRFENGWKNRMTKLKEILKEG